jgi:hypothetical protein
MNKTEIVLSYLETEVKKALDKTYALDCCIAGTRIVLDVLEHFKISARPIVTRAFVCNAIYREWVEQNQRLPTEGNEAAGIFARGGYSLLLGADGEPTKQPTGGKGFWGHLIVYVEEGYVVDITLPQAHRPRHKIYLKPLIAKVGKDFPENGEVFLYPQKETGKVLVEYSIIQNDGYLKSPDWIHERRKKISYPAIAALENYFNERPLENDDTGKMRSGAEGIAEPGEGSAGTPATGGRRVDY